MSCQPGGLQCTFLCTTLLVQVEKLLGEVQSPMGSNGQSLVADDELEGRCRLLDRVCGEVSRINFYAAKGQVC